MSENMIVNFESLYADLQENDFVEWQEVLPQQLSAIFEKRQHGKKEEWESILQQLPDIQASSIDISADKVRIGSAEDCDHETSEYLLSLLKKLHPWRKGPYELFGIHIDTEWHSDWKWQRIQSHLTPLKNRRVLDVGCGNGYHMWRMLADGAKLVVGADPSQFFLVQFHTLKKYVGEKPIHLLPFKGEELPAFSKVYQGKGFDTVFSMGVLYHRVSPIEHLQELRSFLRADGELVLETLVIEDESNQQSHELLLPEDRYAKMRNVWFLPTPPLLVRMLERVGFKNVRVVDINQTSIEEQRSTDWMEFESLQDFLDPEDHNKTIEGYPAPKRAVVICNR
ncbi:tRNA 5-methoxyuridine(34)/uridine 5-oxyacetic acid(34) synthase CmoB [Cocleimonas sp. KMM 6892]|uniref:tRNA 5-methoxyuridine(34)/uridine 5-oxyacetic acid(34) synthase CmoB n=1 Tax=unclassified Cocleimonas TaxID=2639732 RepID=UPI002DBC327B|nr:MULTISPECIES: tRNA 5-methoxyuridine(34)/uridine 5-oxyacetic acid(34) synthase CmoB [unclassified Cocleimonas]MEB8433633.1 tRNA 5-methoxyuridine(34)/uridine 5-oxyacetic acid(34) synthase CmoB [Cocleimonas sp. KMM 6892]MEC4716444.1 tRNA 5-methoxyuridine(34)/uridine 5-oxyacetic acid(34) synthase CmoB [Cocleimonas sp. KMM 6895]MEC4745663.1 tRNA 5-methoxyuridine(34)/uridine 5-oxyacetic acid(34) synthase CmoB [Cocleimonas sp. KMM 6896]